MAEITRDLVRSLQAAIARRSWPDVESAANALDNVEGFHRRQVKDLEAIIASMKQDRSPTEHPYNRDRLEEDC